MVTVKVRETYDLHTTQNKMTVIGIHTPKPDIIKRNYPGLLMQCKAYRPKKCNVRLACASVLPLDIKGVGLSEGDVAPEDVFNPILYKAMSNKGMSQLEARINALSSGQATGIDVDGSSAFVDVDSITPSGVDDFNVYYSLLANTNEWKHAHPQAGLSMTGLRPLVYEMVYNVGDMSTSVVSGSGIPTFSFPSNLTDPGDSLNAGINCIVGKAKEMPFIPCTSYSYDENAKVDGGYAQAGFPQDVNSGVVPNCSIDVPYMPVMCGCIIVPPSRLHELFFRFVCEWEIEFSTIRPISDLTNWVWMARNGSAAHYQNYSYEATKQALTGSPDTMLTNDACMVSSNSDIEKVM